jgi:hypothetical protein
MAATSAVAGAAAAVAAGIKSTEFQSLKKSPEDLEQQAVDEKFTAAEKYVEDEMGEMVDDFLDDTLMPPLDMIVAGLQSAVPSIVKKAKAQLDKFFSSLPCSAILHLLLIETMTIWIFYYSVLNLLTNLAVEGAIEKDAPTAGQVPPPSDSTPCLKEYARKMIWSEGHMSPSDCFDERWVNPPYDEITDDSGVAWLMSVFNFGCLLLCILLWLVVVGNFLWHTSCRFWVRYQSGAYLKASYITRRSKPYRFACALLGMAAVMTILVLTRMVIHLELLNWFLSTQLMNILVVVLSARTFLAPTKPKFEYSELQELDFKRGTFFQTNGGFAVKLSDALIQSARGSQFRGPLVKLLAKPGDWEKALRICFIGKNAAGSPNKQLLKLWGVAKEHLPTAFNTVQEHAPTALNTVKAMM